MNKKTELFTMALELFALKGYQATSIRDIAYSVNTAPSTLYNHYPSKKDLFIAVLDHFRDRSRNTQGMTPEEIEELFKNKDVFTIFSTIVKNYEAVSATSEMIKLWRILYMEQFHNETAGQLIIQETEKMVMMTAGLFLELQKLSLIDPLLNPQILAQESAYTIHAYHMELLLRQSHGWESSEVEERKEEYMKNFCDRIKI